MRDLLPDTDLTYYWGVSELKNYLKEQKQGFYRDGFEGFHTEVISFVAQQRQSNKTFIAKEYLRKLQVQYHDDIQKENQVYHQACDQFEEIWGQYYQKIKKQIEHGEAAIKGISQALEKLDRPDDEKRTSLETKLQAAMEKKLLNQEALIAFHESDDWIELQQVKESYQDFRNQTGLNDAELSIQVIQKKQAKNSHSLGFKFEEDAVRCAHHLIIPHLITHQAIGGDALLRSQIRVLTQVTLKAAQAELDVVIVRLPIHSEDPVKVLAIIEAKRNPDDVSSGFMIRQENIAWFSGDQSHYDLERYRNQTYSHGHFDQGIWHHEKEDDTKYYFDPSSFSYFKRDVNSNYYLNRMYFVTMRRRLSDLPSDQKGLLQHYLSTDHRFYDLTEDTMHTLYKTMQNHKGKVKSSHEIMSLYAQNPITSRRIILLNSAHS